MGLILVEFAFELHEGVIEQAVLARDMFALLYFRRPLRSIEPLPQLLLLLGHGCETVMRRSSLRAPCETTTMVFDTLR